MKTLGIILISSMLTSLASLIIIKQEALQEHTLRLKAMQAKAEEVDRRCRAAFLADVPTLVCASIGTESLFELMGLPGSRVMRDFHVKQLWLIRSYQNKAISEQQELNALAVLQIQTREKLDAINREVFDKRANLFTFTWP